MESLDEKRAGLREADLHLHSLASDGTLAPADVVAFAAREGVTTMALTDHDTTMGMPSALNAAREWGVELIPGIEMTAEDSGEELHILGYFIDMKNPILQVTLKRLRLLRSQRAQQIIVALSDLGMSVDWADVSRQTWESVGRPHIARILTARGYVANPREAFDLYLDPGRPAYVPLPRPSARGVIELIRDAGGVSSLAHPIIPNRDEPWSRMETVARMLPALKEAGLTGLESYYKEYVPDVVRALVDLSESLGLVPSGGSDFHTPDGRITSPGGVAMPDESVERLRRASERLRPAHWIAVRS